MVLAGGAVLPADHVVLALPLGALKHAHAHMFSPPLPREKIEVIEQLEFGLMDKIFLEFEEVFWDPGNPGIQFIMTDTGSDEDDLSDTWWRSIAGFDGVAGQPRVLCGWISGEAAAFMEVRMMEISLIIVHIDLDILVTYRNFLMTRFWTRVTSFSGDTWVTTCRPRPGAT